jgi:hypothetical protein
LKAAIDAFSLSLHQVLNEQLAHLKTLLDAKEAKAQEDADGSGSKCAVFVMNAGSVKAYHEGMYTRIGEHTHSTYKHSNYSRTQIHWKCFYIFPRMPCHR